MALQGAELAVPGTEAAVGFGLVPARGRLGGLFFSGADLHPAALKGELIDFILLSGSS